MILRGLELRTCKRLVSGHSKGFSEMGAEEAGEACVYPIGMIHETEIKSREKCGSPARRVAVTLYREAGWRWSVIMPKSRMPAR